MSKNLVNLTLLQVEEEMDHILAEQPDHIQREFIRRDLFPDLTAYVLSRVPNFYMVCDQGQGKSLKTHLIHESAERQLARESTILNGIYYVLEKSQHRQRKKEKVMV
ncbi:hypothetical protein K4A83_01360 [Spirulina subsalsa FACHB-351]|uniref:Late competence development ComFB family protein n=1 Tax=Spirulina subsalsa FACHB-351 TaxID=234711 RepID=A0ABT3L090_9CYAN|nr:hypothetical protein [Spirulina subsalsa]MCW6034924.1 hypothetical protein [Spirulina subsalsa FACHB-351]